MTGNGIVHSRLDALAIQLGSDSVSIVDPDHQQMPGGGDPGWRLDDQTTELVPVVIDDGALRRVPCIEKGQLRRQDASLECVDPAVGSDHDMSIVVAIGPP